MATASNQSSSQGVNDQQQQQNIGSPISNEAYNVITALQAKLEGLEAYRKYSKDDGSNSLWQSLSQTEIRGVEQLCDELERIVKNGKLRGQAGTNH